MKKSCIWVGLLSLLGFSGCHHVESEAPMYGVPYVNFRIKVTVKNEQGQPIKGVGVSSKFLSYYTLNKADIVMPITNENGETTVAGDTPEFVDMLKVWVYADDFRPMLTGRYLRDSTSVIIKKEDLKFGSRWNLGTASKEVTITMKQGPQ